MAKRYIDSTLLDRAIHYAVDAHRNTERKGKGFPYIVHPLEAVTIVATMTADQELLAAAVLHDTVEDTETTVDDLRREFGERVAQLVHLETDQEVEGVSRAASWRQRKERSLQVLAQAPRDVKIVAMGDKLSNMRAIARDYAEIGDELWERFNEKDPREHAWRYRALARAFADLEGTAPYAEFCGLIQQVFGDEQ